MTRRSSILVASMAAMSAISMSAQAAVIVDKAAIKQGMITLQGKADAGAVITLDGGVAKATADSNGKFDFGQLNYVPESCVIKLTSPGQTTVLANVKNCDPIALKSKGNWVPNTSYITDELVFYDGSTWRAKNKVPAQIAPSEMNGKYWELFAQGGERGPRGATGEQGPAGPQGVAGATGATGITGATGAAGANGVAGTNGTNGSSGLFAGQADLASVNTDGYTGNGIFFANNAYAVGIPAPGSSTVSAIRIWCYAPIASSGGNTTVKLYVNEQLVGTTCTASPGATQAQSSTDFATPYPSIVQGARVAVRIERTAASATGMVSWGIVVQ